LLADSHVALWWLDGHDALGPITRDRIERADEVYFSAVTPWELGIKRSLGKISYPDGLARALVDAGMLPLDISSIDAETAADLPLHHRDPFDRMLVAQAQLHALQIVSADEALAAYDIEVIDASE
jgi:PIN domain nuclease of toxin-antitoxin system